MGNILQTIEKLSCGRCYQTERFSLDRFILPEYQDANEVFGKNKINDNKQGENICLDVKQLSFFSLFF